MYLLCNYIYWIEIDVLMIVQHWTRELDVDKYDVILIKLSLSIAIKLV